MLQPLGAFCVPSSRHKRLRVANARTAAQMSIAIEGNCGDPRCHPGATLRALLTSNRWPGTRYRSVRRIHSIGMYGLMQRHVGIGQNRLSAASTRAGVGQMSGSRPGAALRVGLADAASAWGRCERTGGSGFSVAKVSGLSSSQRSRPMRRGCRRGQAAGEPWRVRWAAGRSAAQEG